MMIKKCYVLCLFFLPSALFSQAVLQHEVAMHRAEDGKLYVNLSEPVYLHISTSPDPGAQKEVLQSEETAAYANPFYFDGEGYNSIRTPWAVDPKTRDIVYPIRDVVFEVYADGSPPATRVEYKKAKLHRADGKLLSGGETVIAFVSRDALSGVKAIYYSIDEQPFVAYTEEITLNQEKKYTIKYYAVDNVGNVEPVKSLEIYIDLSDPVTTYRFEGDVFEEVVSGRTSLVLEAADQTGVKATYVQFNTAPKRKYTRPIPLGSLPEGQHQVVFYSEDLTGNIETPDTVKFYVDKTGPVLMEELLGNSYVVNGKEFSSGRSRMRFTAFDNRAGVKDIFYKINDGEYQRYTEPFFLNQTDGNLRITAYAVDQVNNRSEASAQQSGQNSLPYIDLTGPELSYAFSGPHHEVGEIHYVTAETLIALRGIDRESGMNRIEYSLDGESSQSYNNPFSLSESKRYEITFTGYDQVDNSSKDQFYCEVDNTGPEVAIHFSAEPYDTIQQSGKNLPAYPSNVVFFLTAKDTQSGFSHMLYSEGEQDFMRYSAPVRKMQAGKAYVVRVDAYDNLGNVGKESFEFYVGN